MNRTIYRLLRLNHGVRKWLGRQFTPNGLVLLGGLFIFGLIGLDIKRSLSYQIFMFLLAVLVVSFLLSWLLKYFRPFRLSATRRLPRFGTVGVPLSYRVVISSSSRQRRHGLMLTESFSGTFPRFESFRQIVRPKKNAADVRKEWSRLLARLRWAFSPAIALPPLIAKGNTENRGEVVPLRRGVLRFQKLTLACPEPLGLVNRCLSLNLPQSVLILPKRYELPVLALPGSRRHQADSLALAASVGDSEEFRSLREYRPGDSPRKIHWKSWAKLGRPVVREEQAEFSVRHALILDTFQAEEYSDVLEEAIAIAASFACTVHTQESLLDTIFVSGEAHCFTTGRGQGQTEHLLELLASVMPCQDKGFSSLLPVVRSSFGGASPSCFSLLSGCICVFLTWDSDRKALIEQLQAANIPTLGLIITTENDLAESLDRTCLKNAQSSLHVLTPGKIQERLLNL